MVGCDVAHIHTLSSPLQSWNPSFQDLSEMKLEDFCQELDMRVAGRECKEVLEEDQELVKKIALQLQEELRYLDVQKVVRFWP